ncbi:MAG: exo-alpha-sialidase [Clostridia bacterium]|nr:exo-alpha-sialidase [Clostridia bacterium]
MNALNTTLIERSGKNGYAYYRIPGIIATEKGTLITYYEARQGGDWAVIDIYMQRSTDGGKTWEERKMLFSGNHKNTTNNPVMFVDGDTIHFLCFENYKRLFYMKSVDDGVTFTEPREITDTLEAVRDIWPWTCAAVGPGHGMKMANGRLIATVWMASAPENIFAHGPAKVTTIYSDDHGETWKLGEVYQPDGSISPNEACIAQLSDGRMLMNIRTQKTQPRLPILPHYRLLAISDDGISGWKETWFEKQLPDPQCMGGMCNYPGGILFTNCASYVSRSYHTLYASHDDGKTWTDKVMYEPLAGYSDCCYNPVTKTAFVSYEYDRETEIRVREIEL